MKNLGIIILVLGALLLVLSILVPAMSDLADQNWYTMGSVCLIFIGMCAHVFIKKLENTRA